MKSPSAIYELGITVRNVLYNRGFLKSRSLRGPVVSIGNISVGGSGKTPFVIMLGQLLHERGIKFDVLSRGYGRLSRGVAFVNPAGSARDFGDEPILIARRMDVPVIVGEDRHTAGFFAEEKFGPQLHLLDDGFQHRALARDFDIVLVTEDDLRDRILPGGRLREPIYSLRRADAIVVMNSTASDLLGGDRKIIWRASRGIHFLAVPSRPIVFCGIARPHLFISQLRDAGIHSVAESFYRDHHSYTSEDIDKLIKLRNQSGADGFVTTEKDVINLGEYASRLDPLSAVSVTMELSDAANAVDTILRTIQRRRRAA